jgi:iron complex outermembrane recepter protein
MQYSSLFWQLFLWVVISVPLNAQNAKINGKILDQDKKGISYVNIILYNQQDSSIYKVENTNESGNFQIHGISEGRYFLKTNLIGMVDEFRNNLEIKNNQEIELGDIVLKASPVKLQEAVVSAKRSILEVKPDRTIFNVEGTINNIGSDGISLLRKAPGVTVDNNDNISLLGRSGVKIYIDGKKLPLSGQDLTAYLQNLQAEQIDRIEIITNPGAKYEAEGNAGIIDIRLKQDKNLGTNGSVNANYSQGRYPRINLTGNGNYRNKNINLFGLAGIGHYRGFHDMAFSSNQNSLFLDETNNGNHSRDNMNFRIGMDYFVTKKQTLGFLVGGSFTEGAQNGYNKIKIAKEQTPGRIDSVLVAFSNADNPRDHQTYNINYRFDDGKKRSLNIDLDYGIYRNKNQRLQTNQYLDSTEQILKTEILNSFDTPSDIDIATLKIDFEQEAFGGKVGAGSKLSRVKSDNTFLVYDGLPGSRLQDDRRSNHFFYDENVYAFYINYARTLDKSISLSAGLRAEQTDARGDLQAFLPELQEPPVILNYLSWFPSAGISWQVNGQHNLGLNYGRRINRPDYHVLNPFNNQLSQLSYEKGNPFLKPEIVNNIDLSYTLAYRYNFKIGYSLTTDEITRLIGPDESDPRASFINWDNLATQTIWSFNASLPFQMTKIWSAFFNLSGSHIDNQADYGDGAIVDLQAYTYTIFQQHSFELPWKLKAELSTYYSGPGIWGGVFVYESSWNMDFGLQRKFLDDRLNVKVSMNDIFKTSGWKGVSVFDGLDSKGQGRWDSHRGSISVSYRFGNENVKSRKRKLGLEDEAGRLGSEGN